MRLSYGYELQLSNFIKKLPQKRGSFALALQRRPQAGTFAVCIYLD
ncbi:hypothetical protein CHCC20335_3669 [Bacillus paralicheniformis]|nr:hypothetical protein CHCC20335_3669 [Bacillus paralicheniformis]